MSNKMKCPALHCGSNTKRQNGGHLAGARSEGKTKDFKFM